MAIPYDRNELVRKGFIPAKKADEPTWPVPEFCKQEDWSRLPLHIQVRFADEKTVMEGVGEVHLRRVRRTAAEQYGRVSR